MDNKWKALLAHACEKFEKGSYEEALEAFVLAYEKGMEPEWVLENIYNCYMAGNESEFRETYGRWEIERIAAYDECLLDFIPYRDGEYFIFDKEKCIFRGVFSLPALQETEPDPVFEDQEFSPAALVFDWDFREEADILTTARERKIYMVCHDAKRCLSFWKIPELREYLKNVQIFLSIGELQTYFHENTAEYLPMVIRGDREEGMELANIRMEEHRYRLTPKGRNTDNVLLTIAIPTANRGNLLLKRLENLLALPYDAEIEIAVSKNCNRFYEEEYKKASEIEDARLHYYDHGKDLEGFQNINYVVDMSCGKYVMVISDEDDVIPDAIQHSLKLLRDNPGLSLVRPRGTYQCFGYDTKRFGKMGLEAFHAAFLGQNYISGLIVRRKDFIEANFASNLEKFSDNLFYRHYPHEWWCAVLTRTGDYMEEPVILIAEGPSVGREEAKKTGVNSLLSYGTYESRLKQLQGQIEFLHWFMGEDKKGIEMGMMRVMDKVIFLLSLARGLGYDDSNYMVSLNRYVSICIEGIEGFDLEDEQKIALLNHLMECFMLGLIKDKELRDERKLQNQEEQ